MDPLKMIFEQHGWIEGIAPRNRILFVNEDLREKVRVDVYVEQENEGRFLLTAKASLKRDDLGVDFDDTLMSTIAGGVQMIADEVSGVERIDYFEEVENILTIAAQWQWEGHLYMLCDAETLYQSVLLHNMNIMCEFLTRASTVTADIVASSLRTKWSCESVARQMATALGVPEEDFVFLGIGDG